MTAAAEPGDDLIRRYTAAGAASNDQRRRRAARVFLDRFGDPAGWQNTAVPEQLAADPVCGGFVTWLIVTAQVAPAAEYLLASRGRLAALPFT